MNPQLMHAVADLIEVKDRFDLDLVSHHKDEDGEEGPSVAPIELMNACDTAGCVAGWVAAYIGVTEFDTWAGLRWQVMAALGINDVQADRLFVDHSGSVWDREFGKRDTSVEPWTAKEAAYLLHAMADGKIEL
jgi:hypothetical protein